MRQREETATSVQPTYRLGLVTLSATLLLIIVGGYTRGSGSGYGCSDRWPLCENGLLGGWLPRGEYHMIVEWSHRWLAASVGALAVVTTISVLRNHRKNRAAVLSSIAAVLTILFQAWIGRAIVRSQLDADLVSLHLAISLTAAALLAIVVVSIRIRRGVHSEVDSGWVALVALGAGTVFAVIMLGSLVHNLYFPGWPLMSDTLIPDFGSQPILIHFSHRVVAGLYALVAIGLWMAARRRFRPRHEVLMLGVAAILYAANVGIGAAHVFTRVDSAELVALHLGLASSVWLLTFATFTSALRVGKVARSETVRVSQT